MEVAVERVEEFEIEKQLFLEQMRKVLSIGNLDFLTKIHIYANLIKTCRSINLKKMVVIDSRRKILIDIENKEDLLRAVEWYQNQVNDVLIKQFNELTEPFKTVIQIHEKNVANILEGYI